MAASIGIREQLKDFGSMRFTLIVIMFSTILACPDGANAQFLRNFLSNGDEQDNAGNRDDLPDTLGTLEELSFDQVICRDKEKFPIEKSSVIYSSFAECKANLDRVQDASYIDLTYRIRWDHDRLDLYRPNNREILICDANILTTYEHSEKKDPDWWMIVRTSLDFVECPDEIFIEALD